MAQKITINQATLAEIHAHLLFCNMHFQTPLSDRVNISDYANKLYTSSNRLELWQNNTLTALVALYLTEHSKGIAYASNVSVLPAYHRQGMGTQLIQACLDYLSDNDVQTLLLEVENQDDRAVRFYQQLGAQATSSRGKTSLFEIPIPTKPNYESK